MATTLRVSAETQRRLTKLVGRLTVETGRRVSYDDALRHLLEAGRRPRKAARKRKHALRPLLGRFRGPPTDSVREHNLIQG